MADTKKASRIAILRKYFGFREGTKLSDFSAEVKTLSDAEKDELASAAAVEMGLSQDDVAFPLAA